MSGRELAVQLKAGHTNNMNRRQNHHAVLRVKRNRKEHQAEVLLGAAMEGDVQLLKEMKTIKKGGSAANS